MITLKIDPETNDLVFNDANDLVMVEGIEEEKQSLRLLLSTNINEWFLNIEHGLDYSVIQTKQFDIDEIRAAVMEALSQEERVAEIVEINLEFEREKRTMNISFEVVMVSGNTIEDEVGVTV